MPIRLNPIVLKREIESRCIFRIFLPDFECSAIS